MSNIYRRKTMFSPSVSMVTFNKGELRCFRPKRPHKLPLKSPAKSLAKSPARLPTRTPSKSPARLASKKKNDTVQVPRSVLEVRSPGSWPRMLLLQLEEHDRKKRQRKARSPGAAPAIHRARNANRADGHAAKVSILPELQKVPDYRAKTKSPAVTPTKSASTPRKAVTPRNVAVKKPKAPTPKPTGFTVDPPQALFSLKGGLSSHILINESNVRFAVKIKSSNNVLFRVNPVYSFLDSGAMNELEVYRLPGGQVRDDVLLICFVIAKDDDYDAKKLFTLRAKIQNVTVKLSTTTTTA